MKNLRQEIQLQLKKNINAKYFEKDKQTEHKEKSCKI